MRRRTLVPFLSVLALMLSVKPAAAQFIGTFSWQTQPNCNIVTLNVTQAGSDYLLEGFDDLCGAVRRAPVAGTATLNPNGTVGLGLVIVNAPGGEPTHMDVAVNLATLGGPWSDSAGNSGTFVFNGAGGGSRRLVGHSTLTGIGNSAAVVGRRTSASSAAIVSGQPMLIVGARGFDGAAFSLGNQAQIEMSASENWTPSAKGTRILFYTTSNGATSTGGAKMVIQHNGWVGIGSFTPAQRLDVGGNVRIGTGTIGCVQDRDATVIAGNCGSDARFKRDVVSFEPMLDKVTALRPVHFHWRSDEFPARAFGERQSYGLIAQEVEDVVPELVTTDDEGYKAVNYSKLPLLAIQAIKDLKAENDDLKALLESQLASIKRRLASIEAEQKK